MIAHSAFIDLENALGSRTGNGWKRIFQPIQQELFTAIKAQDWARANKAVDSLNTDVLVDANLKFANTIAVASLLLGASRLSKPADSHVAQHPPEHQIKNALTQWAFVVARNAVQNVRLSLHLMLAKLEHRTNQAKHIISKDESNDPDQYMIDLVDKIRVDGANFMSLAANLMVSRLSSFGFLLEAQSQGIESYEISAILDEATCPVCEALDGQVFSLQDGIAHAASIMGADDADSLKSVAPWPSQSQSSVESLQNSDAQDLVNSGLALPPYHAGCRCITVATANESESSTADQAESAAAELADSGLPNVSEDAISAVLGLALVPEELEFPGEDDAEDPKDDIEEEPDDVDQELDDAEDPEADAEENQDEPKKRRLTNANPVV